MRNVTAAGTTLAVTLLPLAIGVLLARTIATDPLTPVNALVTGAGQRARIGPSLWCDYGRSMLRGWCAAGRVWGADAAEDTV